MKQDGFGFVSVKFKKITIKPFEYIRNTVRNSIGTVCGRVSAVKVNLEVIRLGVEINISVFVKYLKDREEVDVENGGAQCRTLRETPCVILL